MGSCQICIYTDHWHWNDGERYTFTMNKSNKCIYNYSDGTEQTEMKING